MQLALQPDQEETCRAKEDFCRDCEQTISHIVKVKQENKVFNWHPTQNKIINSLWLKSWEPYGSKVIASRPITLHALILSLSMHISKENE